MKMSGVPSVGRLYMTKFSVAFLTCFLSQMANFQGEQFKNTTRSNIKNATPNFIMYTYTERRNQLTRGQRRAEHNMACKQVFTAFHVPIMTC